MSKFCGYCGGELDEDALVCGYCGKKLNPHTEKQPSNKRQKRLLNYFFIISTIIVFCIVAVLGVFFLTGKIHIFDYSGFDTENYTNVFTNQYGSYYASGSVLVLINDDGTMEKVVYYDIDNANNLKDACINPNAAIFDTDFIYAQSDEGFENNKLYKYQFKDKTTLERTVWIQDNVLKESVLWVNKYDACGLDTKNWIKSGDYIFFLYVPNKSYIHFDSKDAYKICRVKKDGSSIKSYGSSPASSFTVNNNWIYYWENGYVDIDKWYNDKFVGLKKMKFDSSEETTILSGLESSSKINNQFFCNICDQFKSIDHYVYYIDRSVSGKSRLYRINTQDNDRIELISKESVKSFGIDLEHNKVYYVTDNLDIYSNTKPNFIVHNLNTGEESVLLEGILDSDYEVPLIKGDQILFYIAFSPVENEKDICGAKYMIPKKTLEYLYGQNNIEATAQIKKHNKTQFNWEEYIAE